MIVEGWNNNNFLQDYWEKINSGEIIVGRELKKIIRKLIRDIDSEEYIYNTYDADLRIEFIEKCCFMTKNEYYGKPMTLMLWQKAWITALYSFKHKKTGKRRFKRSLLMIGRKNGKTELISSLLHAEFWVGQPASELIVGSCNSDTASIIYEAFNTMRIQVDPKQATTWRNQKCIRNKKTNTKIFKLSDQSTSNDGYNACVGVIDESHELTTDELANAILQSQSMQQEPLFINITTNGFVDEGYLDNELTKCRKIIDDEDDSKFAESYLVWLYTQDSEQEIWDCTDEYLEDCEENNKPCVLQKSNPTLGTVKTYSYIIDKLSEARSSKSTRISVLSKDFNLKQNSSVAWLNADEYTNISTFELEEFRGSICIGGVDLAETTDLSCLTLMMFKKCDRTKYIHQMFFLPEEKLKKSDDKNAGADYQTWADEGFVRIVPDCSEIDVTVIADYVFEIFEKYDIRPFVVGYDNKFALEFLKRMKQYTITTEAVLQSPYVLDGPIKLLERELVGHYVNYQNNKCSKWCLGNAALKVDAKGSLLVKPKNNPSKKIDGAVSLVICYEIYRRHKTEIEYYIEN